MTTAQYDEIVQALTDYNVKLTDANGELRGTYEIFEDLSKAWGDMTSMEKSSLAKTLAGNRQQNVFFSLMDQFGEAQKAMKSIDNSSGALAEAYGEYMNSITAHVNQFKAAFTSLSNTIVNSNLVKFVVDSGATILTVIDKIISAIGGLGSALLAVGAVKSVVGVVSAIKALKVAGEAITTFGVLATAFPNLAKSILLIRTAAVISGDAITTLKVAFKSLWSVMAAHPVLLLIAGITALGTALYKFGKSQAEAVTRAEEKLSKLKDSYSNNESEIESVNEKLEETGVRIRELNGLDSLSFSEAEELKRLQQQNAELEKRYNILVATEKELAKERNNAFLDTMRKDLNAGDEIRDNTAADGQAVLGITEETYIKQQFQKYKDNVKNGLNDANEDIVDYFVKKNKEFQERAEGMSYIPDPSTEDERRVNQWLDYINDFNNITALMTGSDPQEVLRWVALDNRFYDTTEALRELGEQGKVTAEDLKADEYKDFIQNLIDIGLIADDSDESLELLALGFNSMGEAADEASDQIAQYSNSFTDLKDKLESFAAYQNTVNDALSTSASATGLTQEQIENLTNAYEDLEGFDAAKLFENTANGVRLNTEELERLNAEFEDKSIEEFAKHLRDLQSEIYSRRAQGLDTSDLEAEYQATSLLKSQYEGLTSSYNKWLKAKSGSKNRDSYEGLGAGYKEMKEILEGGWYGDESLNKYLDTMLSVSQRTGDAAKDFEQLNKTIEGTNHSIMDYWKDDGSTDGIFDFLDDVQKKFGDTYATIAEDGTYSFDLTGDKLQEVADAFGMSTDLVRYFAQALIDAGARVNLSDLSLTEEINNARENLKEFQKEGKLSEGLNLDFNVETDSLESVKKAIEDLEREKLTIDGETDPELLNQINSLIAKTKEQYYIRLNAETDGSLDEAARLLNQIYEKTNGTYTIDAETRNGKEVSDLVQKISELPKETQIAIGIEAPNVGDIDAIIAQFNNEEKIPKIPVEFKPETQETDEYLSHVQDLKMDKEFKVTAIDKSTNVITGIKNALDTLKDKKVTVTTNYKYTYGNNSGSSSSSNSSGKATPLSKYKGTLTSPSRAFANGSAYNMFNLRAAYANGRVALTEDEQALVNELGMESIIRDGRWFLIPGGVHQEALKKGDIILSAAQTKALLRTGAAAGYGRAYADGSILGAYGSGVSGSGASRRPIGGYSNSGSKTTKNTVSKSTAKKTTSNKSTKDEESEFERLYKYHQHLLAMDAESVEDYLNWLNDAYKTAYKNNEIELDDYYSYEEEIYSKLQDLFKDYLDDIEHEISMRENFKGEAKTIVKLYQQMIDAVQAEIKAARAAGLKDTDDYIQDLQDKYWDYYDAIKDIRDDTTEAAKDAIDELIDYRIDMLKKEADKEKDKIQERLTYLRDFYQKQKDLLKDVYDEDKYYENQAEKRKAVTDIQAELAKIEYDNSAWAQRRKLELAEDLAKAQKELDDFEKDHALEVAQDQLDKKLEMQEKELDAETDAIDKSLESAKDLYERALADIRNGSVELYQEMIEYNDIYGSCISEDITSKWEDAYIALKDYFDLYDEHYRGINLANATGYRSPTEPSTSWNTHPISDYGSTGSAVVLGSSTGTTSTSTGAVVDDSVKQKVAAAIWRGGYGWGSGSERAKKLEEVFGANNGIQALVNKGVGKGAAAPGNEYTYLNMRKKLKGYALGTRYATPGIHAIDEKGIETIFESANGTRYKLFTGGEKVLNAEASNFLYNFANNGGAILSELLKKAATGSINNIRPIATNMNISEGDIIIQGNANHETVSEIRRIKRESMDNLLKEINRLNKF